MKKAYDVRSGVRAQSCFGIQPVVGEPNEGREAAVCQFKKFADTIHNKYSGSNNYPVLFESSSKKIRVSGKTFYLEELFLMPKEKVV